MRFIIIVLSIIISLLIIGFIGWMTGWSIVSISAGVFILLFVGLIVAEKAAILTLPNVVKSIIDWGIALCIIIILWVFIANWWENRKKQEKIDAKQMLNPAVCKNEDGKWVDIPAGHYKNGEGECVEGTAPITSTQTSSRTSGEQEKTLYSFSPKGCNTAKIHVGKVDFYPKGGEVEITPPSDSKIKPWHDKPGIQNSMSGVPLPPGEYKICGIDKDAWGIEIWN